MNATEKQVCMSCQGSGKCFKCQGTGSIMHETPAPIAIVSGNVRGDSRSSTSRTCSRCYGSGTCQACKGTGKAS
jgi:hypothetical protein